MRSGSRFLSRSISRSVAGNDQKRSDSPSIKFKVSVFEKKTLVTPESLKKINSNKITALAAMGDDKTFIGTANGYVVLVDQHGAFPIKTRIGAKAVEQLQMIDDLKILVALCDGKLTYHNPGTLRKISSCKDPGIRDSLAGWNQTSKISMFCVMRSKPWDICLAVKRAKKIMIAMWDEDQRAYLRDRELGVPEHVMCMEWLGKSEYLGLGFKARYSILYAPEEKMTDLEVPTEGNVAMHSVGKEMLVSATSNVGVFLKSNGNPANRGIISFPEIPIIFSHLDDYLISILSNGTVLVTSLLEHKNVQMFESMRDPVFIAPGQHQVVVGSGDEIHVLKFAPIERQVSDMLSSGFVAAAERLFQKSNPSEKKRRDFHWNAGWALISKLRFDESFHHLTLSREDPRKVLKLFPELKIGNLIMTMGDEKLKTRNKGIHSILAKSEKPKEDLSEARMQLSRYLWQYRQHRTGRYLSLATAPLKKEYTKLKDSDQLEAAMKIKEQIEALVSEEKEKLRAIDTALLVLFVGFTHKLKNKSSPPPQDEKDIMDKLPFATLADLLLPSNECALEECAEYLQKGVDEPQELDYACLYQSKKKYKVALEVWRDLYEGARIEEGEDGVQPAIELLEKLNVTGDLDPPNLLWEHASWILKAKPREGMRIFTSTERKPPLDSNEVLAFLRNFKTTKGTDVDLVGIFLEHISSNTDNQRYHDMYAHRLHSHYLSVVESKAPVMVIQNARIKLRKYLQTGSSFDMQRMLELISKSSLYDEMIVLYSRLGLHRSVLQTYVYELRDYNAAEKYCIDKGVVRRTAENEGMPTRAELLNVLLRVYLKYGEDRPADNHSRVGFHHLLAHCTEYLDPVETLKLLPDDMPLDEITPYLETVMRTSVSSKRNKQIVSKLVRAERFQTQVQLLEVKRKSFTIDTKTECAVCRKKIGDSYFSAHPPDDCLFPGRMLPGSSRKWTIVHKGCSRKYAKLRGTGRGVGDVLHVR